jgi:hypothetical protein
MADEFQGTLGQSRFQLLKTAPCPPQPAPDVCPDVDQVHTLLIKPGHPFDRLRGRLQPHRRERITQEVEAPAGDRKAGSGKPQDRKAAGKRDTAGKRDRSDIGDRKRDGSVRDRKRDGQKADGSVIGNMGKQKSRLT